MQGETVGIGGSLKDNLETENWKLLKIYAGNPNEVS